MSRDGSVRQGLEKHLKERNRKGRSDQAHERGMLARDVGCMLARTEGGEVGRSARWSGPATSLGSRNFFDGTTQSKMEALR